MFDISFTELLLIGVIALVVIGPEKLPKVARTAGHLLGRAQRYVSDVKSDIQREIDADEFKNLKGQVEDAARTVKASVEDASKTFSNPLDEARDALKEAADTVNSTARQTEAQVNGLSSSTPGSAGDASKASTPGAGRVASSSVGGAASSSGGADSSPGGVDSSASGEHSSSAGAGSPSSAGSAQPPVVADSPSPDARGAQTDPSNNLGAITAAEAGRITPGSSTATEAHQAAPAASLSAAAKSDEPVPEWNDTAAEPEIPHELLWDASEAAPAAVPRVGAVPSQPEKPAARHPETKQASTPPVGPRPSSETST